MKKISIALSVIFFFLFLKIGYAIEKSSCSKLDQEGATYYLTQDIIDSSATYCMWITANNVVLDCQGHTIDGTDASDSYGIYIDRFPAQNTNITVKNCIVTDWDYGIYLRYANNNTIINLTSNSNSRHGIVLYSSNNNTIINPTSNSNSNYGIYLYSSSYNKIINSTSNSNSYFGINLYSSSYNQIINSTSNSNSYYGIYLFSSSNNNTIIDSTSISNYNGILLSSSSYNQIINSTISNSNSHGIYLDSSSYNTIINLTSNSNSDCGIVLSSSNNNTIINSIFNSNSYCGIALLYSSSYNNITGGSIALSLDCDYLLQTSITNYFTDTNFTKARKIRFYDSSSWFNYRNESNGIWIKNKVSAAARITRMLNSWEQTNITWTEQATSTVTAEYNLTGLLPNTVYYVQNSSGTYQIPTDSEGNLNFQTQLTTTVQTISVYYFPPYIEISSCSVLDQEGATYYLTQDIIDSSATYCMNITANNVVLDCQGHTIDGTDASDSYGIYIYRISAQNTNITVKNCIVTDWDYGIYLGNANNNTFTNNSVSSNFNTYGIGIYLDTSSNNTLTNNTASSNDIGIYIINSNFNILTNNTANSNSEIGIYLDTSSNNTLTNNTASSNDIGIYIEINSNFNILTNNTANSNSNTGIYLSYNSNNTLINNIANSNSNTGIYLDTSSNNTLINNTANSNTYGIGIYLDSSSDNTLINNIANSNTYGIYLSSSYSNTIKDSTIQNNTEYGIYIYDSESNLIYNNIVHFNSVGIKLDISGANNIINGSIALSSSYDYLLRIAGSTNTFTNTNFTESRKINFDDSSSWFNYRNESNGMWLKNIVSTGTTITRTLHSWEQTNITWTEQADTTVIAEYNLTGLLPNTVYYVQNSSGTYQIPTDSEGNLNFQTQLTTTVQTISVYLPVYLTVTFNYNSVNFGSLNHNTLNPAPNQESGIYNVSVEAGSSYKVEAYGNNFEGPASLSISNLYFDTAPSPSQLSFSNSVSLSTSPQVIDSNIPPSVTVHYHGYWLNIPYKQKKGNYYTTVYIIYSLE